MSLRYVSPGDVQIVISSNHASCTLNEALFSFSDKMGYSKDLAGIEMTIGLISDVGDLNQKTGPA